MVNTTGHAVVDGSRSKPSVTPKATIMARDSHVAPRESINREQALLPLSRYIIVISIIHNAKTKMLRGKQNRSTGKLPKHNCATIDNVANPTNMQPLVNGFLYDANIAITGVKGNLIF